MEINMKELINYIAKSLVDAPELVHITEETIEDNTLLLKLSVGDSDLGKVIGKQGRTARAMRTLLSAAGVKKGQKVRLEIVDNHN